MSADRPDDTVTWRQLWAETADAVGDRNQARWLCEVASASVDGDEFLARLDEPATERMVSHLDTMVARYRTGEPLQYVLGEWSFRHITLSVDRRVLIPRPETELVAEIAIGLAVQRRADPHRRRPRHRVRERSGCRWRTNFPARSTEVWITDASVDAIDVARANLAGIGPAAANVRVAHGSWFEALPHGVQFDVIVSNPPYVAVGSPDLDDAVGEWEPSGRAVRRRRRLGRHQGPGRRSAGSVATRRSARARDRRRPGPCRRRRAAPGGLVDVEIRKDLSDRDRVAIARRPTRGA